MDRFFLILKKLFPTGDAFLLSVDKNWAKFVYSLTALFDDFRTYINLIYLDLFPDTTRSLELWCETFGLSNCKNDSNTRMDLATAWKSRGGQGADYLQTILNSAGFNVQVHENNPPVDPDVLLSSIPWMVAGGEYAYAGNTTAIAGKTGGDLLVNGSIVTNIPLYNSFAGASYMSAGNELAVAGLYDKFTTKEKVYKITNDPDLWGGYFFIGGDVTRDPVTHKITAIENVSIPTDRKADFLRLILRIKPAQTWVGLLVSYV